MHILVTDRLACARCGPEFGLILLADELKERRLLEGALACFNCREQYPVEGGFGDLRPLPRNLQTTGEPTVPEDPEASLRLAALFGVIEGPGLLLIIGPSARNASLLSRMIEGIEIVAVHPELRGGPEQEGVSRLAIAGHLPFLTGSLRGVALEGEPSSLLLPEAVRVLGSGSRLVFLRPPDGTAAEMEDYEMELLVEGDDVLVGVRK